MAWTKDQKHVLKTHMGVWLEKDRTFYIGCPRDVSPALFMDDLARLGEKDVFFSVSLARANIFFRAAFIGYDDGGLCFREPDKIYKVQRRKDLRFTIQEGHVLRVSFQDPLFPESELSKKAADISAGGIAMYFTEEEKVMFHPGMVMRAVTFTIQGRKIVCDAEVKHVRAIDEGKKGGGIRIGVEFVAIKAGDAQHIAQWVFEESRKYYTRFL